MTAEYILSTDAPRTIIIQGEGTLEPFVKYMDGEIIETFDGDVCEVPFTNENALKLRNFLKGKDYHIPARERKTLEKLANDPNSIANPDIRWNVKLTDLKVNKLKKTHAGIKTEWDLVHYLPLRYLDKTNPQKVSELLPGAWAVVVGTIVAVDANYQHSFVKIVIADVAGQRISASFFRQLWLAKKYKAGDEVVIYGNYSIYVNKAGSKFPQITNPQIDVISTTETATHQSLGMVPIYPQKSENKSWAIKTAQEALLNNIVWIDDPVPETILKKYNLVSRVEAYKKIHFPDSQLDVENARRRIAFDEFIRLQVFIKKYRSNNAALPSASKTLTNWSDSFKKSLGFNLTSAQERVSSEILADMKSNAPMYRLLQGDVGSGKTEISSVATLVAVESGYQVALLAPTDILATQLHERLTKTFRKAGITEEDLKVGLFTGKILGKKRTTLLESIKKGEIQVIVGTHALAGKNVQFADLGLAIIDEMHKFGAEQRSNLRKINENGSVPDMLMMSATPIPRTMAQVLYGNLDVSIVDELPAERIPIHTEWHTEPDEAWVKIREEVEKGHQAYVVAALVEDSEKLENVESAVATYTDLKNNVFPDLKVGLLHGKLSKEEKNEIITAFYAKEIEILVATSIVEVGVNVPSSTCMVILNANRFGIASLHQIRGRVGRGAIQSYCYLVGQATMPEAEERLSALVESNDGFWLAEKDLEIRGEGTIFSTFQSGDSDLFVGNLKEHKDLIEIAKKVAKAAASSVPLNMEIDLLYKDKKILA